MVQILSVLKVPSTGDSVDKDLFYSALSDSQPSLFFGNNLFTLGFKPVQEYFSMA